MKTRLERFPHSLFAGMGLGAKLARLGDDLSPQEQEALAWLVTSEDGKYAVASCVLGEDCELEEEEEDLSEESFIRQP